MTTDAKVRRKRVYFRSSATSAFVRALPLCLAEPFLLRRVESSGRATKKSNLSAFPNNVLAKPE